MLHMFQKLNDYRVVRNSEMNLNFEIKVDNEIKPYWYTNRYSSIKINNTGNNFAVGTYWSRIFKIQKNYEKIRKIDKKFLVICSSKLKANSEITLIMSVGDTRPTWTRT